MFKKFPSIENSYQPKHVAYWLRHFPLLEDETYIIEEKVHGANIQLLFQPNEPLQVGKRTAFIPKDSSFFGVWNLLETKYVNEVDLLQKLPNENNVSIRVYGEVYGVGVQKEIYYGQEKYISFFAMTIDDNYLSPMSFHNYLDTIGLTHMSVPVLGFADSLDEAMKYQHVFQSTIAKRPDGKDNFAEGVVIKPYYKTYLSKDGSVFRLKHRHENFAQRPPRVKKPVDPTILKYATLFQEYVNENRLLGVFSKEGGIEKANQMSDYIRWTIRDAREDFLKDYPEVANMTRKEQGRVFNAGGKIAKMLRNYL